STTEVPSTTADSTAPASGEADPQQLVEALAMAEGDLLEGESAELREQGAQVVNQVTLDYCGFTFTTEKQRLARHQVNVYLDEDLAGSNEAVLYAPGQAEVAMDEVRQAISECPPGVA